VSWRDASRSLCVPWRQADEHCRWCCCRFVDLVLLYATSAEMSLPTDANYRNFATHDADDVEFKQLLWSFVGVVCGVTQTSSSLLRTASTGKRLPRPQHGASRAGVGCVCGDVCCSCDSLCSPARCTALLEHLAR
jgi:hypothetical protein